VCTEQAHGHGDPCGKPSEHADHHPRSKRELIAAGLDDNHPAYGRGLCHSCHSKETAKHQPAGWNDAPPF
jgi:5-methylcytosine-specific restriction protein A